MNIEKERDLIYSLFSSNWHEDKSIDRHWNSKSGFGVPICDRCHNHWWSHWVYLKMTTDRLTKFSKV